MTATIKMRETTAVATGPTFIPADSSSKNRINPAPANGIGPSRPRRLDRFDFFFDMEIPCKQTINALSKLKLVILAYQRLTFKMMLSLNNIMHIRDFQNLMKSLYFERDRGRGFNQIFLWIIEEIGELAEALRKYQDHENDSTKLHEIEQEIADVVAWVASLANVLDIDLEKVLFEKYPLLCPKCRQNPCTCDL